MASSAPGWIWRTGLALVCLLASALVPAQAQKFKVLHTFHGSNGGEPLGVLVRDPAGNIYGTTGVGGTGKCSKYGCGTAFKLNNVGKQVWLHSFQGANGFVPSAGMLRDAAGICLARRWRGAGSRRRAAVFKEADAELSSSWTTLARRRSSTNSLGSRAARVLRHFWPRIRQETFTALPTRAELPILELFSKWTRVARRRSSTLSPAGRTGALRIPA